MAKQQQQLNHVNAFTKGIMQDVDINKIPPEYYFTGEDIKLLDKKGQGFILTNVDGNEYAFVLTEGFIPLGSREHKDVLYVASCDKNATGVGEIGTFPSINPTSGEWELIYRPLRNYTDALVTNIFRCEALGMFPKHRVEIEIRDHYDGTVNLYLADGQNQLRSINSGFTQDGTETFDEAAPPYNGTNIDTKMNLVLGTQTSAALNVTSITTGGAMKYGSYIFFFKYLTENLDDTYWIAESSAVPIVKGLSSIGAVKGGAAEDRSDKKVTLSISNPDNAYKYIKIGYLRHFSDYNGVATYEFGEIATRYNIDDAAIIDVIGTEGETFLEETEVLLSKDSEIIPATITQLANRLWGARWKKIKTHDSALARFAKLITINFDTDTILDDNWDSRDTAVTYGQYLSWQNYEKKGYFRGEAYPFGVVFELNDGSMSEVYPLRGVDQWNTLTPDHAADGNDLGVFRFPNGNLHQVCTVDGELRVALVKMDIEAAMLSIMGANENNWVRFNVRAIHFVRGDRYINLMYQGLMIGAAAPFLMADKANAFPLTNDCSIDGKIYQHDQENSEDARYAYYQRHYHFADLTYESTSDPFWGHDGSWDTVTETIGKLANEKWGPVFRGYAAVNYTAPGPGTSEDGLGDRNYVTRFFIEPDKYCFYSPDMLVQPFNDVDDVNFIFRMGKTIYGRGVTTSNDGNWIDNTEQYTAPRYQRNTCKGPYVGTTARSAYIDKKVMVGEDGFVRPGDTGYNDFINSVEEPYADSNHYWYWRGQTIDDTHNFTYVRSTRMAKYLGIDLTNVDWNGSALDSDDFNLDIVNIYKGDPSTIDIKNLFPNTNSIQYKKIGSPIQLAPIVTLIVDDNWDAYKTATLAGGDCFLQRTFFKQSYWAGSSVHYYRGESNWDSVDLYDLRTATVGSYQIRRHAHGLVLGIVTENAHNVALRSEDDTNTFYPATELFPFCYEPYNDENVESFKLNFGYDKNLSTNIFLAYDPDLPEKDLEYMTRVKYSDAVIPGSYVDAYRSFRINNYQDFDTNFGPIMNLEVVYDRLVSIHEDAIVEHYVNERITQNTDGGSPILGYGDVLSKNFRKMANFGTQHKWSVVSADQLYGVDWKRKIIWEVGLHRSDSGSLFLNAKDLTKEAYVQQWMRETAIEISDNRTDKVNIYGDNTMYGEGIVSGYDDYTKDVYFIFHKRVENV